MVKKTSPKAGSMFDWFVFYTKVGNPALLCLPGIRLGAIYSLN